MGSLFGRASKGKKEGRRGGRNYIYLPVLPLLLSSFSYPSPLYFRCRIEFWRMQDGTYPSSCYDEAGHVLGGLGLEEVGGRVL